MFPAAHQGNSVESELFKSLKAHLNNRNRLQPFIGLSSVIECVNGGAPQRDAFYICEVCVCRLDLVDMRNHIMGSLHRYNYTRSRHPELLSEFREGSCLSQLAWPLMDIAKKIEEREGPGSVQVVEFDKSSFQQMESQSENAQNVVDFLKDTLKQSEPEISDLITSKMCDSSPSQRLVLYSPRNRNALEKKPSPQTDVSDAAESNRGGGGGSSVLSDYAGPAPLVGLVKVIECKSEDGQTYCCLCHCCRVRTLKHDIIDHLTSPSHIINYLMEAHPEKLEMVDLNDVPQLELLAEKLNKDEAHSTKLKVVQIPESVCVQMTTKTYHWCVKKLGWNNSEFPVKHINIKRQRLSVFPNHKACPSEAGELQRPKEKKAMHRTKKRNNPVFKVTLPITQGSLLVKRTSFSKDRLPSFTLCPTEDLGPSSPPASELFAEPQNPSCNFAPGLFDWTSESTSLTSEHLNSSSDLTEHTNENIKQEMEEPWRYSFEDQTLVCKTSQSISNTGLYVDNTQALTPQFHCDNVPLHGVAWSADGKDNQRHAPHTFYQQPPPPQYSAPDYVPQQQMFSYVQGGFMFPQVPQAGNSVALADCGQSSAGFYSEHRGNAEHYSSYEVSSSFWGTPQSAPQQPPCYGPCCVPPYAAASFPNVKEPGSSSTLIYPMSSFYSTGGYPC